MEKVSYVIKSSVKLNIPGAKGQHEPGQDFHPPVHLHIPQD